MQNIKKYALAIMLALLGSIDLITGALNEIANVLEWQDNSVKVFRICMGVLLAITARYPPKIKRPYNRKKQPPYVDKN
jgi:hypothetical protein